MNKWDNLAIILMAITFFVSAISFGYLAYYTAYIGKPIITKNQQRLRIIGAYLIPLAIGSFFMSTSSYYPKLAVTLPTIYIIIVSFFTDGIFIRGINRKKFRELMINTLNSLKIKYTETLSAFIFSNLKNELLIIIYGSDGIGLRLTKKDNELMNKIVSEMKKQTNESKEYISESSALFFLFGSIAFIVFGSLLLSLL